MIHTCPHCNRRFEEQEPEDVPCLTVADGKYFLARCAELFNVQPKVFYLKYGNLPHRREGDVNLSEIRRAVAYRLRKDGRFSLKQIACIAGLENHTSSLYTIRRAKEQLRKRLKKDQSFIGVYDKIKAVPLTDFYQTEQP